MSFNFGQYRRQNGVSYMTLLTNRCTIELITLEGTTVVSDQIQFIDKAIMFPSNFTYGSNYYIRFSIGKFPSDCKINFFLRNSEDSNTNYQYLQTSHITGGRSDSDKDRTILELLFTPNGSYDLLTMELQREKEDYITEDLEYGTYGRILDIETKDLQYVGLIKNILGNMITNVSSLTKIGVQGPPGLLMCINGEPIRIGPSGIYEIRRDFEISFIGFVVLAPDNNDAVNLQLIQRDFFILDYQY